jgi:RimJ/RimL family protein N-acetyltransferase
VEAGVAEHVAIGERRRTITEVPDVVLRPFRRAELALVEPWFSDADTQRWLGGPRWPALMLDLAERPLGEFRGAVETGRHRFLGWDGDAVGYIDCGTYDRWATWEGGPHGRGVIDTIDVPAGAITYVVDPGRRRRGYATAMIDALLELPELARIELFAAGVEPDHRGSVGCLIKAGFTPLDPEPDWEGVVYYVRSRCSAAVALP